MGQGFDLYEGQRCSMSTNVKKKILGAATPYINDAVCVCVCVCVCDNVHTVQARVQRTFCCLWFYSTTHYRELFGKIRRISSWNNNNQYLIIIIFIFITIIVIGAGIAQSV